MPPAILMMLALGLWPAVCIGCACALVLQDRRREASR
mgnify:CR=1 FL=1